MNSIDSSFKDLYFPIDKLEDENYRSIESIKEFEQISYVLIPKSERIKTIKFIIFMYDKNSPLVSAYSEIKARKKKALELLDINLKNNNELYHKLTQFEDESLVEVTAQMLRKQNDSIFSILVSQEIFLEECLRKVLQPLEVTDDKKGLEALEKKAKISEAMEKVVDRIEKYRSKFFRNDDELETKVRNTALFTPESIANL